MFIKLENKGIIIMVSFLLATLAKSEQDLLRLFDSLENQTDKNFELVIVSQANHNTINNLISAYTFKYKHIEIDKKGLSLARNVGLKQVEGYIISLTDDDCWYTENAVEFINNFFKDEKRQIACFMHMDPEKGKYPKSYPDEEQVDISKRRILQQASIDIFVNIERVPDYKIGFDETFGLGAKYKSGEENIFLMDMKNKGYHIDFFPELISFHPIKEKSGKLDFQTMVGKGPLFKRLFGYNTGFVLLTAFVFKKYNSINDKKAIAKSYQEFFKYKL
ncbi:glycosyltransferase family A protein [Bacillus marinisedimentorum]|uniref:glycosyltransferase family A protein n=1 Tax=Bacillus marinisedimentorum TaxID=1821260 RepID=UPI0009F390DB|nr:glycosyltransferase family A protein [Bacillus marinisedimentorum]